MPTILGREPVAILATVQAIVGLVVAFGLDVSTELQAALVVAVGAVLALVARHQVTPVTDPRP